VRVEPVAAVAGPAGHVDLPHARQRKLIEKLVNGLASIAVIGPDGMQVKKDPAVRGFRDAGDKFAIGQLIRARLKVVDASLDGDGHGHR